MKGSPEWDELFDLLVEGNKVWAKNSSVLILLVSKKIYDHQDKPNINHSFDAGAAWENLALQASMNGFYAHAMAGFDHDIDIPEKYNPEIMIAIGKIGKKELLSEDLQAREKPSDRLTVEDFSFNGLENFKKHF